MPVLTSIATEGKALQRHTSSLHIEAGYGRMEFRTADTAANLPDETVILDLEQLEYPFETRAVSDTRLLPGSFISINDGTDTAIATPDAVFTAGDTMDGSGSNEADVQFGQGAAIFDVQGTNGSDRFYVKLNKLSYPFHFQHNGSHIDTVDFTVVGDNSIMTSA